VISLLKATFTHLVIDLSKNFTPLDLAAMEVSDTILLITRSPDGCNDIAQQFLIMSRTGKPVNSSALHPNNIEKDEHK
jgi:hypothetical protein